MAACCLASSLLWGKAGASVTLATAPGADLQNIYRGRSGAGQLSVSSCCFLLPYPCRQAIGMPDCSSNASFNLQLCNWHLSSEISCSNAVSTDMDSAQCCLPWSWELVWTLLDLTFNLSIRCSCLLLRTQTFLCLRLLQLPESRLRVTSRVQCQLSISG